MKEFVVLSEGARLDGREFGSLNEAVAAVQEICSETEFVSVRSTTGRWLFILCPEILAEAIEYARSRGEVPSVDAGVERWYRSWRGDAPTRG